MAGVRDSLGGVCTALTAILGLAALPGCHQLLSFGGPTRQTTGGDASSERPLAERDLHDGPSRHEAAVLDLGGARGLDAGPFACAMQSCARQGVRCGCMAAPLATSPGSASSAVSFFTGDVAGGVPSLLEVCGLDLSALLFSGEPGTETGVGAYVGVGLGSPWDGYWLRATSLITTAYCDGITYTHDEGYRAFRFELLSGSKALGMITFKPERLVFSPAAARFDLLLVVGASVTPGHVKLQAIVHPHASTASLDCPSAGTWNASRSWQPTDAPVMPGPWRVWAGVKNWSSSSNPAEGVTFGCAAVTQ